ncbi:hypothetical protein [Nostoc sp.]|uniref:hypothetical protein n=1 Tax=Nostoc sp. TaxID=1180 RepID=UPI002FF21C7C
MTSNLRCKPGRDSSLPALSERQRPASDECLPEKQTHPKPGRDSSLPALSDRQRPARGSENLQYVAFIHAECITDNCLYP